MHVRDASNNFLALLGVNPPTVTTIAGYPRPMSIRLLADMPPPRFVGEGVSYRDIADSTRLVSPLSSRQFTVRLCVPQRRGEAEPALIATAEDREWLRENVRQRLFEIDGERTLSIALRTAREWMRDGNDAAIALALDSIGWDRGIMRRFIDFLRGHGGEALLRTPIYRYDFEAFAQGGLATGRGPSLLVGESPNVQQVPRTTEHAEFIGMDFSAAEARILEAYVTQQFGPFPREPDPAQPVDLTPKQPDVLRKKRTLDFD